MQKIAEPEAMTSAAEFFLVTTIDTLKEREREYRDAREFLDRLGQRGIDKRFAVLTKIVDFLIGPYITDTGYDFYDGGFCWKYCNYIYFGLTQSAPRRARPASPAPSLCYRLGKPK